MRCARRARGHGGDAVRSAARKRAARARGLWAISAALGLTARRDSSLKLGAADSAANRLVPRGSRRRLAAPAQKLLDPPILERVERHDGEPAAGRQQLLGGGEAAIELAELVIDGDPQRLERPGRRILPGLGFGYRRADDLGELGGAP